MKRSLPGCSIIILLLTLSLNGFSANHPLPQSALAKQVTSKQLRIYDSLASEVKTPLAAKVCACQILKVNSKNHKNMRIAVLVEKTGSAANNDAIRFRQIFEKEKKYMKYFFYEDIRTVHNVMAPTSCNLLYKNLQETNTQLQLYQVLDADIRNGNRL